MRYSARKKNTAIGIVFGVVAVLFATAPVAGAQATPTCDGKVATIVGTPDDDNIFGTNGDDVIITLQGNDRVSAGAGDDTICAGKGDDVVRGGDGFDVIFGAQGNDQLFANFGEEGSLREDTAGGRIFGGAGDDLIIGSDRWDRMQGGPGNDIMRGFEGRDWMRGGADTDDVSGGLGIDDLHGGNGTDRIAIQGADLVRGGNGVDTCILASEPEMLRSCGRNRPEAAANEPRINFPVGTYRVGTDAPLGLYRTNRYWQLDNADRIAANDFQLSDGFTVAIVDRQGLTIEFDRPATRVTSTTPRINPVNINNGRVLVGLDIAPGTYRVTSLNDRDAKGFLYDVRGDIMDTELNAGSVIVTIPPEAAFFDFEGRIERIGN